MTSSQRFIFRCAADADNRFEFAGSGCLSLTGYTAAQLLAGSVAGYAALVHPDDRDALRSARLDAFRAGEPFAGEYRLVERDGTQHRVFERSDAVRDAGGTLRAIEGLVQQTDGRRRDEALLDEQRRLLEMIARERPLPDVLDALALAVQRQAPGMLCSVLLLDADGKRLRRGAAPSLPEGYSAAIDGVPVAPDAGSCGTAAFRREQVIVSDIASDPLWVNWRDIALAHGLRACWSAPIVDAEQALLGTFAIYYREPAQPPVRHRRLIELATQTAAIAISHHAARAALRNNLRLLESTLENMAQGVLIVDAELRVVRCNARLRQLLGSDDALAPGTPVEQLLRQEALQAAGGAEAEALLAEWLAPLQRREPHRFERERAGGGLVEVRGVPVPGDGFAITYSDLSAGRRTMRELERFRAALNLSPDMITLVDVTTMTVVDCNDGACRALGYAREELLGMPVERMFVGVPREALRSQYAGNDAGTLATVERVYRRKDGSTFAAEVTRRLQRTAQGSIVVAISRDLTERQRHLQALAASRERLRTLVEGSRDAVVQMDARGIIVGWNAPAAEMLGWSAAQAIGRPLDETIVPPRFREAHRRGLARLLATGEGPMLNRLIEMPALHRDGHELTVELTVAPSMAADGEAEFTAFMRDTGPRRRAEAERRALEAQLRESQKLEAIGTLAGGIAHDFNNILAAIVGNVALALDDLPSGHPSAISLEQVQLAASRARSLVQQILTYSRRQPQQLRQTELAPLVRETLALLRSTLPAGVALTVERMHDHTPVRCDATQVQQVLMNLCTNAWHAMNGKTGRITIGLDVVDADAARRAGAASPAPHAHLFVRDNGIGMDAATVARIFEPFFTTKGVGEGTGLGLAVVQGIVAAHGGLISVDSQPGAGSTFHVYLPLAEAAGSPAAAEPLRRGAPRGRGQHVLYVDDDEVLLLLVERLLERAGFRATLQRDPRQALAAVRADPDGFAAVVTDHNMPELSGLDVVRELHALRPRLPLVITSGLVTELLTTQAREAGARAVLNKERTLEDLVPLLCRLLELADDDEAEATAPQSIAGLLL